MKSALRFAVELSALASIGIGLWWFSPSASLVAVGSIVLSASILGKLRGH